MQSSRIIAFTALLTLCFAPFSVEAEGPDWAFEFEKSERARFAGVAWHEKDYGWLLTARFSVKSRYVIRPVTYLQFEGLDANGEIAWKASKTIRRRQLSGRLDGRVEVFIRMLFKGVPVGVVKVRARFENRKGVAEMPSVPVEALL